jgi:hypothetical protein
MRALTPPSPRVSCGVDDIPTLPQTEIGMFDAGSSGFQVSRVRTASMGNQEPRTMTINRLPAPQATVVPVQRSTGSFRVAASQSYMRRRLEYMNRPEDDPDVPAAFREPKYQPGSIAALPLEMQIGFRRKMLSVFALQLLLLTGLMGLLTYEPTFKKLIQDAFDGQPLLVVAPLIIMIATLALVYLLRAKFPLNWIMVLLFSIVLSVFLAGLQVWITTNAALYCCGFTFVTVCVMVPLSGLTRKRRVRSPEAIGSSNPSGQHVVSSRVGPHATAGGNNSVPTETVLRSSTFAGAVGFVVTAGLAGALFGAFGREFVTPETFGYSMLFELVLITWFSFDANSMYNVMTPDEYMNGVVYFYMDLIALVALTLIFGGVMIACTALGPGAGIGYCDFYGCCLLRNRRADDGGIVEGEEGHEAAGGGAVVVPQDDGNDQW